MAANLGDDGTPGDWGYRVVPMKPDPDLLAENGVTLAQYHAVVLGNRRISSDLLERMAWQFSPELWPPFTAPKEVQMKAMTLQAEKKRGDVLNRMMGVLQLLAVGG